MPTDQFGDPLPPGAVSRLGTIRFGGPGDRVTALAFAPDSKTLASGGEDCSVRLWNPTTGKELRRFGEHQDKISALAFSADGKLLASGSRDGAMRFWEVTSGRELRQFPGHGGAIFAFAFAADGKTLVSASSDQTIRFWDVSTGRETRQLSGSDLGTVHALAFAPDGKTLVTGSWESTVRLCDLATGQELRQFAGHRSWVQSIAYAPDGRTVASGSNDETIRLWEVVSGKERLRFPGHKDGTFSLAFAPDGKTLASAGADATILVWDVTSRSQEGPKRHVASPAKQLDALWLDLVADDAVKSYKAAWSLAAAGSPMVAFLKGRLALVAPPSPQRVANLIGDLNHDQYATREKATQELEKIGALCEPALRAALQKQPPTEVRRRLEKLLDKTRGPVPSPDTLVTLRVVEVLELTNTPEAVGMLQAIMRQAPPTVLTQEAKTALERLTRRGGK